MSSYYPNYSDVIEEAYDLREYIALKSRMSVFFTDTEALEYASLFPTWEDVNRKPGYNTIVRSNDKIFRVYSVTFPAVVTLEPQQDPEHYYEINDTEWSEYVSGTAYAQGARVKVSGSGTDANYYISKTNNNTAAPTDGNHWYSIGPYKNLYYINVTSL